MIRALPPWGYMPHAASDWDDRPPLPTADMFARDTYSKLLAEMIGTFLLTYTIAVAAGSGAFLAAVAIGSTLMTAIYAGGHISGAHYNPAVTLAIFIRGKIAVAEAVAYVLAQILGGFLGGVAGFVLLDGEESRPPIGAPDLASGVGRGSAFLAEVVITFALAWTVLNVATTTAQANNSYYGLAIGFTVLSGAISVGGVSGGCFNPAVVMLTFVRAISTESVTEHVWIHIVGPLLGGGLAGALFVLLQPSEMSAGHPFGAASASAPLRKQAAPYVYEAVGTFLLCFTVACAASPRNGSGLAPLSIGSMLMAQVYSGGSTSGANYNPAVTLAVWIRKAKSAAGAAGYVLVQCIAALCAGGVGRAVVTEIGHPVPADSSVINDGRAFWAECVATFFLCYVVLQTATNSLVAGNSFFGLAIGYTVAAMAVTVGPHSGGAFNPAVGLLGLVVEGSISSRLWIFWIGPLVGGALAGGLFRLISVEEKVITHKSVKNLNLTETGGKASRRRSTLHADPPAEGVGESFNKYFPTVTPTVELKPPPGLKPQPSSAADVKADDKI